jgi:hypothetical protein
MADLRLEINDEVTGNDKLGGSSDAPERSLYTVTAESGLFKNGQHYPKGSQVPLDVKTAQAFAAAGDIQTQQEQTNEQPTAS